MKERVALIAVSILVVGMFTGCSGQNQTAQEAANPQTVIVTVQVTVAEPATEANQNTESTAVISEDESKEAFSREDAVALVLARVNGATESDVQIHLDTDDGRRIYEGSVIYKVMEYDFEIDAQTGDIIEWEAESIYD